MIIIPLLILLFRPPPSVLRAGGGSGRRRSFCRPAGEFAEKSPAITTAEGAWGSQGANLAPCFSCIFYFLAAVATKKYRRSTEPTGPTGAMPHFLAKKSAEKPENPVTSINLLIFTISNAYGILCVYL